MIPSTARLQTLSPLKLLENAMAAAQDTTLSAAQTEALQRAKQAAEWDPNPNTKAAIQEIVSGVESGAEGSEEALMSAFGKRIAFGTAGLRGAMAAGYANMNDLVVLQAAQGLVAYLKDTLGEDSACQRGLVLGWDHRAKTELGITSQRFAAISALAAASAGMKVHLYTDLVATPLVPWAVDTLGAAAGVMVTASHNPAGDNGYKVYWGNGAQIIPPHDKGIAASIAQNLAPWDALAGLLAPGDAWAAALAQAQVAPLGDDMVASYIHAVGSRLRRSADATPASTPLVYTAMHGVGYPFVQRAFKAFGLPAPLPTASQVAPDPTFPTVAFPNPEEGAGALAEAMAAADAGGADLILANDPDADRLAVAERDAAADGGWRVFTGNEIAALLADWVWQGHVAAGGNGQGAFMLASTVSSKMLGAMARKRGFTFLETLTGFKWMGNKTAELREAGHTVLFSFEEAIGFCIGDIVKDKDGVAAAAVFAEMAGALAAKGVTVGQHMTALYEEFGYFVTNNRYLFIEDADAVPAIFERLIAGGKYSDALRQWRIASVRDLHGEGVDTAQDDKKPLLPTSASTHMLTYTFENGAVITLRTSGTEPKLKYYAEMSAATPDAAKKELAEMVEAVIEDMLQPAQNKLRRP